MSIGCVPKARTALASETGRIATIIERDFMTGSPEYMTNRIPETTFDPSMGANPRTIRMEMVPPNRTEYQAMLAPPGTDTVNYPNPADGGATTISAPRDKLGAGCNIAGETIYSGLKEFGRCLRATALETEPICILDLLEKRAVGTYIMAMRDALPRYAREHFGNELRRQVIKNAMRKYSIAGGLPMSTNQPYFPARPTGGADIDAIRRIEQVLRHEGWDKGSNTPMVNGRPALQVYMGRDDIEFAIRQYKRKNGIVIQQGNFTVDDPTFGKTEIHNGIQFIEDPLPTKGYVVQVGTGLYEFREIQPWKVVAGLSGLVKEVEPEYYAAFVTRGGERHVVYSVGYIVHPKAMERQAMGSIPKVDGKPANKMFNFEVNMVDDWAIAADPRCNKDKMYVQYRMLHAYAPLPYRPELMTAFLFIAAAPQFDPVNPNRDEVIAVSEPTNVQPFNPAKDQACGTCDPVADVRLPSNRTCDTLFPANGAGVIGHGQLSYYVDESAGGLTIVVRRTGGSTGAASVVATNTPGTATSPANFTAGSPVTLNWADGEFGIKTYVVPIIAAAGNDDGKQFTVVLSSVTGSTLSSDTTATVTILDPTAAA